MRPTVILAGDAATASELERAGLTVVAAADAEDAVRLASTSSGAAIVLDRQHCGALELVAAVTQLSGDGGRPLVVIDRAQEGKGDDLTQALRRQRHVTVCARAPEAAARLREVEPGAADRRSEQRRDAGERPLILQPQLIPVVGAKGGVGKTTVAVHLAALLAGAGLTRTAIADLAFGNADVKVLLDVPDGPTVIDIARDSGRAVDLAIHAESGLTVIGGPTRPEEAEQVSPEQLEGVVQTLRQQFEVLILDMPHDPTGDFLYHCIDRATVVLVVSTLDAAALKDTRQFLNVLKRLNVKLAERVRLVLNRVRTDTTMDSRRAEDFLGLPVAAAFPDDPRAIDAAGFAGSPLTVGRPNHAITAACWQLAGQISPALARPATASRPGIWRRAR